MSKVYTAHRTTSYDLCKVFDVRYTYVCTRAHTYNVHLCTMYNCKYVTV